MLDLLLPYINGEPGRAALNDVMELGSPPVQGRLLVRLLEISQEIEKKAGQKRSFGCHGGDSGWGFVACFAMHSRYV